VILVGLTGGIGSGKSTVSRLLEAKGAVIVDADEAVREVQQPGSPLLDAIADRFGDGVIAEDGSLDRAALAAVAFVDKESVTALNAIVHPAVRAEMQRRVDAESRTDHVVVLDIPLLTENPRRGLQGIIVVDLPEEEQVRRLVELRGFTEADARARIAQQATREARLATASVVVDNRGDLAGLSARVDEVWEWLRSLPPHEPPAEAASHE